jgi:type IV fimbrial biogenesis protein FimT
MPALPSRAGFTLVELVIALAIAAVLAAVGMPSFADLMARQRLQAVVEHLRADIALARREAGGRAQPVHIVFQPGADWCYALGTGPATDCRQATVAAAGGLVKLVRGRDHPGVQLLQAQAMQLDPRTGAQPGGETFARFATTDGRQLQVRLGPLGHASVCAPAGPVGGAQPCPDPARPH